MRKLILIGAGGYAKSVLDSVDYYNYQIVGFIDQMSKKKEHLGYPILGRALDDLDDMYKYFYFISIGNNEKRCKWYTYLLTKGLQVINVVDRSALISPKSKLGNGCFVGKLAIINSKAIVGNDCIINTRALVEHGCVVNDHVNISTNSVINGDVIVGEGSFIGSCSVTIGQLQIGQWSTVGAGSVVVKNVEAQVTVAGVPAKVIKKGAMLG